jgi:hypothetical protein
MASHMLHEMTYYAWPCAECCFSIPRCIASALPQSTGHKRLCGHWLELAPPENELAPLIWTRTQTPLEELPIGADVRVLRDSQIDDCIDITYKGKRYFALKNELLRKYEGAR